LRTRIFEAKRADAKANTSKLEEKIDDLVYDLYDLTEDEIAIVESKA
jgi:adenine-specific DNA-methyltransferase